jgi:hypothetical protein
MKKGEHLCAFLDPFLFSPLLLLWEIYICLFYFQRPPKLSFGFPHPDPVVETSSLSAVQPPEPTYKLTIMKELDETNALSSLQIETIVYACQVSCLFIVGHHLFHEVLYV